MANHSLVFADLAIKEEGGRILPPYSVLILDEAQNTTSEQMKMFLTRIGFSARAVITGDITQVDLPRGAKSGLREALEILEGVPGISFTQFTPADVMRNPLVQRIIEAYESRQPAEPQRGE